MKTCEHCGAKSEAWEANCTACKKPFVVGVDPDVPSVEIDIEQWGQPARPNGKDLTFYGGVALGVGLVSLVVGWLLPVADYSFQDIDPARLALKSNLMLVGALLSNLGLLTFLAGKVIEAIWHLPGKDEG